MKWQKIHIPVQIVAQVLLALVLLTMTCAAQTATGGTDDAAAMKDKLHQQIVGANSSQPMDEEYVVGYRDILHVSIYGEGSMSASGDIQAGGPQGGPAEVTPGGEFVRGRGAGIEVRLDGRISLRHIGDVAVVGMNMSQLAGYLKQLYSAIYDDPQVTVTLVQSNSRQYTVMGQVVTPGLYHLDFPITIVRAVARAGGFTEWAKSTVSVIRPKTTKPGEKGEGKTYKFDFDDFLQGEDLEKNIEIQSGDVIVVH
jgi:polysaccharide export outer membrane protein